MPNVLFFDRGISLLLDEKKKQPLFNRMTAFIPAGCPLRSVVLGREVECKTLFLDKKLFIWSYFMPEALIKPFRWKRYTEGQFWASGDVLNQRIGSYFVATAQ
jgi:hypothetical protein